MRKRPCLEIGQWKNGLVAEFDLRWLENHKLLDFAFRSARRTAMRLA